MARSHCAAASALLFVCMFPCSGGSPPRGGDGERPSRLNLESAVEYALANSHALQADEWGYRAASRLTEGEQFYWEPEFTASIMHEDNRRRNSISDVISQSTSIYEERNWLYSSGVQGRVASGATWRLGYTLEDQANNLQTFNSDHEPFDSEYVSFVGLTLTQPLMRNFGPAITQSELRHAELREEISRQELRRRRMLTVGQAELAYWSVWQAARVVDLRKQSVDIAKILLEDNRARYAEGKMSAIEVEQAKAGLAIRERRWLEARTRQEEAVRQLMTVIGMEGNTVGVDVSAPPPAPDSSEPLPDAARILSEALSRQPDILIRKREADLQNLRVVVSRNQRLPELDLVASYGVNGLGEGVGESMREGRDADYESWSVGVMFRMGIGGDKKRRAQYDSARHARREALAKYRATWVDLSNALETICHTIERQREILKAVANEVETNRVALEAEKSMLESGRSTSRAVLQLEDDMSTAEVDQVLVQAAYRRALAELDITDGGMLVRRGLEPDDQSGGVEPAPSADDVNP